MSLERKAKILEFLAQIVDMGLEGKCISEIAETVSLSKSWVSELLKSAENYGYVKIRDAGGPHGWVRIPHITEKGRICIDKLIQVKETCRKPYIEFIPPILVSGRGKRVRSRETVLPALKEVRTMIGLGRTEGVYYKIARYTYDRFGIRPFCLKRQENNQ